MRLSNTNVAMALTLSLAVASTAAAACNGNKGGGFGGLGGVGGGYGRGGLSVGIGTGIQSPYGPYGGPLQKKYDQSCDGAGGYNQGGPGYGQQLEPFHSYYVVQPGDTLSRVSRKEYGTTAAAPHIARFNRLAPNATLAPGQQLMLPSISANGQLSHSRANAAVSSHTSPGLSDTPSAKFAQPQAAMASTATTPSEPLPKLTTGSVLSLEGQSHGTERGVVRLKIAGLAIPVEVLEWTAASAKVRLPALDLPAVTKAELEVVRADGSVASSNAVELTTASSTLAAKN